LFLDLLGLLINIHHGGTQHTEEAQGTVVLISVVGQHLNLEGREGGRDKERDRERER
jgi:hypothetical protein